MGNWEGEKKGKFDGKKVGSRKQKVRGWEGRKVRRKETKRPKVEAGKWEWEDGVREEKMHLPRKGHGGTRKMGMGG